MTRERKNLDGALRNLGDVLMIILAVILFSTGVVNLKNFSGTISLFDLSYVTFFEPFLWMVMIGVGIRVGAIWIKLQFTTQK